MDAMYSFIEIKYNDDDTKRLTDLNEGFSYTDNASGEADSISLFLNNQSSQFLKNFYPDDNDYIKAWINARNWKADNKNSRLFCGKFLIDAITLSGFPQKAEIKGISVPIKTNFNVTQKNKTWKKTNTKSILSDLAKSGGLKLIYDADNHSINEISQNGQTDLSFAFSLCSEYGLSLKLYNNKLIAYDQTRYEKKNYVFTINKSDLCGDYSFSSQITQIYDSVKIQYTKGKETLTYSFTISKSKGNRTMFITSKADSLKEAEVKAKAKLRENLRKSKKLTLTLTGDTRYLAAQNFKLDGFGKIDGIYFIDQATHDKSNGKWTCTIVAHPVVINF